MSGYLTAAPPRATCRTQRHARAKAKWGLLRTGDLGSLVHSIELERAAKGASLPDVPMSRICAPKRATRARNELWGSPCPLAGSGSAKPRGGLLAWRYGHPLLLDDARAAFLVWCSFSFSPEHPSRGHQGAHRAQGTSRVIVRLLAWRRRGPGGDQHARAQAQDPQHRARADAGADSEHDDRCHAAGRWRPRRSLRGGVRLAPLARADAPARALVPRGSWL